MSRVRVYLSLMFFSLLVLFNAVAIAGSKDAGKTIKPVWVYIGSERVNSIYNPNGAEVICFIDKASAREHASNKDWGFWVARILKEKNEMELTYTRVGKNKKDYAFEQRQIFYLDGTFKDAEKLDKNKRYPLNPSSPYYNALDICKGKIDRGLSADAGVAIPDFSQSFNKLILRVNNPKLKGYYCFLDDAVTGLEKQDDKNLTIVSYAYSPEERNYYLSTRKFVRTGPTSYRDAGGNIKLLTYENKLLFEKVTKEGCLETKDEANTVDFYYEFYRHR